MLLVSGIQLRFCGLSRQEEYTRYTLAEDCMFTNRSELHKQIAFRGHVCTIRYGQIHLICCEMLRLIVTVLQIALIII